MKLVRIILCLVAQLRHKIARTFDPVAEARRIGVCVGRHCRLINVTFGTEPYLVTLGDHVSATATTFITHDGGVWVFRKKHPDIDVIAPIRVGNNVFFGFGTIVLPGVTIGDNVVIGAGSVVTRDIPGNVVVAGVPARVIRTLDEYWQSVQERVVPTKGSNEKEKRRFLLSHFGIDREQWKKQWQ